MEDWRGAAHPLSSPSESGVHAERQEPRPTCQTLTHRGISRKRSDFHLPPFPHPQNGKLSAPTPEG